MGWGQTTIIHMSYLATLCILVHSYHHDRAPLDQIRAMVVSQAGGMVVGQEWVPAVGQVRGTVVGRV